MASSSRGHGYQHRLHVLGCRHSSVTFVRISYFFSHSHPLADRIEGSRKKACRCIVLECHCAVAFPCVHLSIIITRCWSLTLASRSGHTDAGMDQYEFDSVLGSLSGLADRIFSFSAARKETHAVTKARMAVRLTKW